MKPSPLYNPDLLDRPAYHLWYTWTGWPSETTFPSQPDPQFFKQLKAVWKSDGIRILKNDWSNEKIQIIGSVKPTVSPVLFTARIKGRLQHALRLADLATKFSRKVSFRSIGKNNRQKVEGYIRRQVRKENFVDPRFEELMSRFTVTKPNVKLQEPVATNSGRYWYNLHLVLVTENRFRFREESSLHKICQLCDAIAEKKGYRISVRSTMPDHIHISLGGEIEQTPQEIALAFMNNIAFGFDQQKIWRPSYYVGTFGEYDISALNRR